MLLLASPPTRQVPAAMQALGRAGASTDSDDGLLREMRAVSAAVGAAPVVAQRAVISGLHCLRRVWPSAAGGPIAAASSGATALAGDDASWASWAAHMHHTAYAHAMSSNASEELRGVVQRFECELSAHASFASWRDFLHVLALVASGSADVPFSQHVCGTECCEQRTGALTFWHCLSAVLGAPTGGVSALRSALVHAAFLAPIAFIGGAASFMRTTTYAVVCDAVVRVAALRDCEPLDSSIHPSDFHALLSATVVPGAGALLYTGCRVLSVGEGATLPSLLALCGDDFGGAIVCCSRGASWASAETGVYVALLPRDEGILYYDADDGVCGPFAVGSSPARLAGTVVFTCPLRALFIFTGAASAARVAARAVFAASLCAPLVLPPAPPAAAAAAAVPDGAADMVIG